MAISDVVFGKVLPEKAAGGFSGIGQFVLCGNAEKKFAFGVVGVFTGTVADGPGFLDVVGDGGGSGPDVAIAGDVAAVVEVVEDAELAGEFVLIRGDVFTVHGYFGVAVGFGEVAKELIVGAIFLDDVNDVVNLVFAGGEWYAINVALGGIGFGDESGVRSEILFEVLKGMRASEPLVIAGL